MVVLQEPCYPLLVGVPNLEKGSTGMFGSELHLHLIHLLQRVLGKVGQFFWLNYLQFLQTGLISDDMGITQPGRSLNAGRGRHLRRCWLQT